MAYLKACGQPKEAVLEQAELDALPNAPALSQAVQVDAGAVAAALAKNDAFLQAVAKAVADEMAKRMAF